MHEYIHTETPPLKSINVIFQITLSAVIIVKRLTLQRAMDHNWLVPEEYCYTP